LTSTLVAWAASFTPVAVLLAVAALLACVVGGRRWMALAAAVVLGTGVATQVPLYRGTADVRTSGVQIRLMQANIRLGGADARALRDEVAERAVDLLTVIELTDQAVTNLVAAGLREALPYACERPRAGGGGAGVYSRYPLRDCSSRESGYSVSSSGTTSSTCTQRRSRKARPPTDVARTGRVSSTLCG